MKLLRADAYFVLRSMLLGTGGGETISLDGGRRFLIDAFSFLEAHMAEADFRQVMLTAHLFVSANLIPEIEPWLERLNATAPRAREGEEWF